MNAKQQNDELKSLAFWKKTRNFHLLHLFPLKKKKEIRHAGGYSEDILCELLMSESYTFNQIMETDDVDLQTNIFNNTSIKCLDKCAPVVTREITRPFAPQFNDDSRQAIKKRDDTRSKLKRDGHNTDLQHQFTDEMKSVEACLTSS